MPNIPNIARGFFYPTSLRSRCPNFSRCIVTNKCNNYDAHNRVCALCETRVRPNHNLGGLKPELEFEDDVQNAVKIMRDALNAPMVDQNAHTSTASVDIEEMHKLQESMAIYSKWSNLTQTTEEDATVEMSEEEYHRVMREIG
jgi:hypothetical protein